MGPQLSLPSGNLDTSSSSDLKFSPLISACSIVEENSGIAERLPISFIRHEIRKRWQRRTRRKREVWQPDCGARLGTSGACQTDAY